MQAVHDFPQTLHHLPQPMYEVPVCPYYSALSLQTAETAEMTAMSRLLWSQNVRGRSGAAHLSSVVILGLAKSDQGCCLVATLARSKENSLQ